MVPLLGGAFSACVYHLFYNSPELDALVAVQVRCLSYVPWQQMLLLSWHVTLATPSYFIPRQGCGSCAQFRLDGAAVLGCSA